MRVQNTMASTSTHSIVSIIGHPHKKWCHQRASIYNGSLVPCDTYSRFDLLVTLLVAGPRRSESGLVLARTAQPQQKGWANWSLKMKLSRNCTPGAQTGNRKGLHLLSPVVACTWPGGRTVDYCRLLPQSPPGAAWNLSACFEKFNVDQD
jgi:hypothetical protein